MKSSITIIVAYTNNLLIGKDNSIPWHISDDLKRFKKLTTGNVIIMGRKTFESLGSKPLPNRTNIVVTRNTDYHHDGVIVCKSIEDALSHCKNDSQPFVIGGGEIYSQTINIVDKIELTRIYKDYEGDAYFPDIPLDKFKLVGEETYEFKDIEDIKYSFLTFIKK